MIVTVGLAVGPAVDLFRFRHFHRYLVFEFIELRHVYFLSEILVHVEVRPGIVGKISAIRVRGITDIVIRIVADGQFPLLVAFQ